MTLAFVLTGMTGVVAQAAEAQPKQMDPVSHTVVELDDFIQQAETWLLSGELPPPELPRLLDGMTPSDRLMAVVYLRRSGLLTGPELDPVRLLTPQEAPAS